MVSDAAGSIGEVQPNFDAAKMGTFGADGRGNTGAKIAGRADVTREFRMDFAELRDFIHRGLKNLFLGVETGAHRPFVKKMEERAGFIEADGLGVRKKVQSDFEGHAAVEQLILGGPRIPHGSFVSFLIFFEKV